MRVDAFDFELPDDRIALRPAQPRSAGRLLVVEPPDSLADRTVGDLPDLLRPGDLMIFNDTRVIAASLEGRRLGRESEPRISVLLHQRLGPSRWTAFARPGKRLRIGDIIRFGDGARVCLLGTADARVEAKKEDGEIELGFDLSGPVLDEIVAALGDMPLPPYIASRRTPDEGDRSDYQTIYAREDGAVAAPTAGLHFTDELMAALEERSISHAFVTLHVGAGTFLPVKADDTDDHRMHAEHGHLTAAVAAEINRAKCEGRRIVAVGTTSLRLLESAAEQEGRVKPFEGETRLFITPGYSFKIVDVLMTNFHLPRSSLFMLVAAFSGLETMRTAYAHAIAAGYRFYSYGDASLLYPAAP